MSALFTLLALVSVLSGALCVVELSFRTLLWLQSFPFAGRNLPAPKFAAPSSREAQRAPAANRTGSEGFRLAA